MERSRTGTATGSPRLAPYEIALWKSRNRSGRFVRTGRCRHQKSRSRSHPDDIVAKTCARTSAEHSEAASRLSGICGCYPFFRLAKVIRQGVPRKELVPYRTRRWNGFAGDRLASAARNPTAKGSQSDRCQTPASSHSRYNTAHATNRGFDSAAEPLQSYSAVAQLVR